MKIGSAVLAVAACLAAALPAQAQQAPDQVGYWPLDEAAGPSADLSGSGISGTWQGGGPAQDTVNKATVSFLNPGSLNFDGTDDWIDLGNPAALPAGTAARSMCAWARTATIGGTWAWIVAYGTPAGGQAMFIGRNAASLFGGGYGDDVSVPNFWAVGVWHHIALTYDGTTARLYADGVEAASMAKAWNLARSTARIGRQVNTAAEFWSGQIDDVRIYTRALTQTEVAILAGGSPAPTALAATAGVNQVALSWTPPANAAQQTQPYAYSYRVQRSTTSGSGYVTIATVTGTTYDDLTALAGTPYYYVVTAVSAGESGNSNEETATAAFPPPRTKDHDEGLFDGKCSCGSAGGATPMVLWIAAALLALTLRPR